MKTKINTLGATNSNIGADAKCSEIKMNAEVVQGFGCQRGQNSWSNVNARGRSLINRHAIATCVHANANAKRQMPMPMPNAKCQMPNANLQHTHLFHDYWHSANAVQVVHVPRAVGRQVANEWDFRPTNAVEGRNVQVHFCFASKRQNVQEQVGRPTKGVPAAPTRIGTQGWQKYERYG